MKKNLSLIIMAMFMVSFLAACGTGSGKDEDATMSAKPESTQAAVETKAPEEPYELQVSLIGGAIPGFEELAKEFETQNPGITVKVTRTKDGGQYQTLLKTQLATKEAPDIFLLWPGLAVRDIYAKGNYVEDLSDLEAVIKISDGLKAPFTYDGKTYAVPYSYNFLSFFYNKDMFAKYGLEVPVNWDEFIQVADTLKKNGIAPIALPAKGGELALLWYIAAPSTVYAETPDWDAQRFEGTVSFTDSAGWKDAADKIKQISEKKYMQEDSLGTTYDQARGLVIGGKAAMYLDGNWALPQIKEAAAQANMTIGSFIFPFNNAGEPMRGSAAPGNGPAVWSGSKHKDGAKKLIEFVLMEENALKLIGEGAISSNKNVKIVPEPILSEVMAQMDKEGTYQFLDIGYPAADWGSIFTSGTQQSIGGRAGFDKTLQDLDTAWNRTK